jgi:hypothetical protein
MLAVENNGDGYVSTAGGVRRFVPGPGPVLTYGVPPVSNSVTGAGQSMLPTTTNTSGATTTQQPTVTNVLGSLNLNTLLNYGAWLLIALVVFKVIMKVLK